MFFSGSYPAHHVTTLHIYLATPCGGSDLSVRNHCCMWRWIWYVISKTIYSTVECFEIKLTSSSLLSVPVQRRSSPVTASLLSIVSPTCPPPPPPPPSLCRDFDRPKVSLKAELFNSVSCRECLRRRWPCAVCPQKGSWNMKQSSVWGSKVHGAGGNQRYQELLYYIHHSQYYIKGNASCMNLIAINLIHLDLWSKNQCSQLNVLHIFYYLITYLKTI